MSDSLRLFLIEDDDDVALLIRKSLERVDHVVTRCRTAADALIVLAQSSFDLVLLDQRLPDMEGLDLLQKLAREGIAVPVLIHLTQRERRTVVEFPSLMFLRKIPYESVRRRRIRDWLLLALRAAALALIVAAFARPFVRGSELSAAGGGAREIVVLLDRSYSMAAGESWARAQAAARAALQGVGGADRISLVLFGPSAELMLRSSADVTLAVTGFAGPAGKGCEEGLVHFASARRGGETVHRVEHFGSLGRGRVRVKSLEVLLEMLKEALDGR